MKLTPMLVRAALPFLSDGNRRAPREVLAALATLSPPDEVIARLTWSARSDGTTTWRVLWLTEAGLSYCEAMHPAEGQWSFDSEPDHAGRSSITARLIPVRQLRSVQVADIRSDTDASVTNVAVLQTIEVDGMAPIPVPLSGELPTPYEEDACSEFLTRLREVLRRVPA
ncbi:hypothetical protein [Nocardioides sp. CFH 31398]|uniref:hypothetical protein n=1 Tax=Nocardioides sp. CFH 31398 TaxID=2919579 RepID=UPI001F054297|nr:hypothetical protein [Nocardioides sp. CFH 31398]MCH1867723.1 hypothetical protein [Nocardioides sp. CFH 31398]